MFWFATQEGSRYDWVTYWKEDGLSDDRVVLILEDQAGELWFATHNGLSRYDGIVWRTYHEQEGLLDNRVPSIIQDKKGAYWIGAGSSATVFRVDALDLDNVTRGETVTVEVPPPTGRPQYTDLEGNPVYIVKLDGNTPLKQDFEDLIAFAQAYDSSEGDDKYNVLADTDQNETVEFADFIRFAQAYEREAVAINGHPIVAGKTVE